MFTFEQILTCVCAQGEQCNVVPDTIDDIVADIGQEEKEDGTVNTHTNFSDYYSSINNPEQDTID